MTSLSSRHARKILFAGAALLTFAPTLAQETITYQYDARGRLIAVSHSGAVNNGLSANYTYDKADNRTNVTVAGTTTCAGASFSIGNASANEGSNLSFTVAKNGTTSDTCTVNYATANGTAVSGTNYTAKSGSLSFASGINSQVVTVATIDDHVATGAVAMYLNLSSPSGSATISNSQDTGTINNIDTTTIQLASGTGENLRTIANANGYTGATGVSYTFVAGSGVTITGAAGGGIGIDTGSWPAGVNLYLTVNGIVRGGGGVGGVGGSYPGSGGSGGAGGDAVRCNAPITITVNSGGIVQAGGGGGGGGSYTSNPYGGGNYGGGGGGGGAPNGQGGSGGSGSNGSGSSGSSGTTSGGGAGGGSSIAGGAGGAYGQAGVTGSTSPYGAGSGSGGAAGYAVRKNGTSCTAGGAGTITGTVG